MIRFATFTYKDNSRLVVNLSEVRAFVEDEGKTYLSYVNGDMLVEIKETIEQVQIMLREVSV